MTKKIIREVIIMLLLALAIILILGVLLYEYVPSNKIIPDEVSYKTPEPVKEELSKSDNVENEEVILTYSVDATDLDNYERINTYVPGKPNPFSSYSETENPGNGTTQNGNSTGKNNNTNSGTSAETNNNTNHSGGSAYYPNKGTK